MLAVVCLGGVSQKGSNLLSWVEKKKTGGGICYTLLHLCNPYTYGTG